MKRKIEIAAVYSPGKAIFGADLLELTSQAWDKGINLSGAAIVPARACNGGVLVRCTSEEKFFALSGEIDN